MGSDSLGWAAIELDENSEPCRLIDMGSRIYGDSRNSKDKSTLASKRTAARSQRRRRDRYLQRRKVTLNRLVQFGLMPADEGERKALESINPWRVRAEALDRELTPYEVGRAIFHLQQRRGFKSNRKADRDPDESSQMLDAIKSFQGKLGPNTTVGQFLWAELNQGGMARARRRAVAEEEGEGKKKSKPTWDFYVDRAMVQHEFDRVWESQRAFNPEFYTDQARDRIHSAIFSQRDLKPKIPGKCFLETGEPRAPRALPSAQLFRLYQEVNNLRVITEQRTTVPLTREQRDKAIELLRDRKSMTYESLAKQLGVDPKRGFSVSDTGRKNIPGDETATLMSKKSAFGKAWFDIDLHRRDSVVRELLDLESESDEATLVARLQDEFGLPEENASHVVRNTRLPDAHFRLSEKAIAKLLPIFSAWDEAYDRPYTYDRAVIEAGYASHSSLGENKGLPRLPYYGEIVYRYTADLDERDKETASPDEAHWGRIGNPTVHVGLNQLRKVVNALIARYGNPSEIHIEVARDMGQTKAERDRVRDSNNKNKERNDKIRERLAGLGQKDTRDNRIRLELWEELGTLNHRCVFTGRPIELGRLFTRDYEIDHILPYSRTLDDGFFNKILITHAANAYKGNRSPFEAFGESKDGYEWESILQRISELPKAKQWRFAPDAMKSFDEQSGFLERQLNDTKYLSRVAKQYLECLIPSTHRNAVVAVRGKMTADLRRTWGLNTILAEDGAGKNRADHRHHAIDAVVIALTSRSLLQRFTRYLQTPSRLVDDSKNPLREVGHPWSSFREEVEHRVNTMVVSHKPEHSTAGQFLEETAYGVVEGPDEKTGKYKVRVAGKDAEWKTVVPIYQRGSDSSAPYKAYVGGANYCIEIVRNEKGNWQGEVISLFQANQRGYQEFMRDRKRFRGLAFSGRPLVMRLCSGDSVAMGEGEERQIFRVRKISSTGNVVLDLASEANANDRAAAEMKAGTRGKVGSPLGLTLELNRTGSSFKKDRGRRVFVTPLGEVRDPGFRE